MAGRFEEGALSLLLVLLVLVALADAASRLVTGSGVAGGRALALHLMAWVALFGASYGIRIGAHIGVDAGARSMPRLVRRPLGMVAILLCLGFCALMAWGAWQHVATLHQSGAALRGVHVPDSLLGLVSEDYAREVLRIEVGHPEVPVWIARSVLLAGFALLVWRLLVLAGAFVLRGAAGLRFADEATESLYLIEQLGEREPRR